MTVANHLLMLACSGAKGAEPARALDLYRGVMYSSYRAHVRAAAQPHVVILSALHGFLEPDALIAPYDQRMNADRSRALLADLTRCMAGVRWPTGIAHVMLAGGAAYRRVMHAALARLADAGGHLARDVEIIVEVSGGIGWQRAQLETQDQLAERIQAWMSQKPGPAAGAPAAGPR